MPSVDDENPFGDNNPFGGLPFLGDLSKMFGATSGSSWDQAKQIALAMATGNESEPNVDPSERIAFEQIARVAELQAIQATGLEISSTGKLTIRPATRGEWATATIAHYRTILETIGGSLGQAMQSDIDGAEVDQAEAAGDPTAAMMQAMMQMLGPMMLSMTAGTMVGHLAQRSLGFYDLPVPRGDIEEIIVVHSNLVAFTDEWSLPTDDVRLWVSLNELLHHAVLRVPHVAERFTSLLSDYASNFEADHRAIEERFGDVNLSDPNALMSLQDSMQDPDVVLGAMQSDRQREVLPYLSSLVAVVEGYIDHILDEIGSRLIGSYGALSEALRRRRITAAPADRFVDKMLGLELDQACYERGQRFVAGVVERDRDSLNRLWESADMLPTPAEVDAPGLWLARIELAE